MKKFRSKHIHQGHTGKQWFCMSLYEPLTNPVNTSLLTAIFLHKALTSTAQTSLTRYFDFKLESLSYERWFRMNSHANDTDFLSRHVSVLKQHKLITLIGEVFPKADIAKTYCLHSFFINICRKCDTRMPQQCKIIVFVLRWFPISKKEADNFFSFVSGSFFDMSFPKYCYSFSYS